MRPLVPRGAPTPGCLCASLRTGDGGSGAACGTCSNTVQRGRAFLPGKHQCPLGGGYTDPWCLGQLQGPLPHNLSFVVAVVQLLSPDNSLQSMDCSTPSSLSITISRSLLRLMFIKSVTPNSFPASGSFPRSQLFASGGLSIGISASVSILPMNFRG